MPAPLATRALGRTGLNLTEIGFGAGPLGGFYGPVAAEDAVATVEAAWNAGIRYFDVAPLYGHGRAELLLGHVLREKPRDEFVLSTKVGRYLRPPADASEAKSIRSGGLPFVPVLDYSRDGVFRSLEQSFQRLGVNRLDIVLIHDVDAHAQGSDEAAERTLREAVAGALPALIELKRAGAIRAIGIGVNQVPWARRWLDAADLDCVMIAGRCTLLNQEALAQLFPACEARGIGILAAGAFNGGLLARREEARGAAPRFNYRPAPPEVLTRLERLEELAAAHKADLTAAALQYPLRQPAVSSLVVGAMRAAEIVQNVTAVRAAVPEAFWQMLAPAP